jgi:hypothetical protein
MIVAMIGTAYWGYLLGIMLVNPKRFTAKLPQILLKLAWATVFVVVGIDEAGIRLLTIPATNVVELRPDEQVVRSHELGPRLVQVIIRGPDGKLYARYLDIPEGKELEIMRRDKD